MNEFGKLWQLVDERTVLENEWGGRKESTERVMLHLEKTGIYKSEKTGPYISLRCQAMWQTKTAASSSGRMAGLQDSPLCSSLKDDFGLPRTSLGGTPKMGASLAQQRLHYTVIIHLHVSCTWRQGMYFYHTAPVSACCIHSNGYTDQCMNEDVTKTAKALQGPLCLHSIMMFTKKAQNAPYYRQSVPSTPGRSKLAQRAPQSFG